MNAFDWNKGPFENFQAEFAKAGRSGILEPNAMSLATCDSELRPSVRTVLFKGIVDEGFSFYTNYESQKGLELSTNPQASLLFFWPCLGQQIRIQGSVRKMPREQNEKYFSTRPRLSQIGAWVSKQSQPLNSLQDLENAVVEKEKQFSGQEIPCPPNWGGFLVLPMMIEFWFAREGRLHERYVYERNSQKDPWQKHLKNP